MRGITRRGAILGGMVFALDGCGNSETAKIVKNFNRLIISPDEKPIDPSTVEAIPYASMVAKIGDGPTSVIVLGSVQGNDLYWYTADHALLVTRHGRLIRTAGFPYDLKDTRFFGRDPLPQGWSMETGPVTSRRSIDIEPGHYYGMRLESTLKPVAQETVPLVGKSVTAIRLQETCMVADLDWSFENTFWYSLEDGSICKTIQYYSPWSPPLESRVGRPYAGA